MPLSLERALSPLYDSPCCTWKVRRPRGTWLCAFLDHHQGDRENLIAGIQDIQGHRVRDKHITSHKSSATILFPIAGDTLPDSDTKACFRLKESGRIYNCRQFGHWTDRLAIIKPLPGKVCRLQAQWPHHRRLHDTPGTRRRPTAFIAILTYGHNLNRLLTILQPPFQMIFAAKIPWILACWLAEVQLPSTAWEI
jgi:hypothetical protein